MPNVYFVLAALVLATGTFFYGQHVKDVEWVAKFEKQKKEAVAAARADEQQAQGAVNEIHQQQISEWRAAADSLADSLIRLQQRVDRPSGVPSDPRAECQGANGRELSRHHAQILERFAYRCQACQVGLKACKGYAATIKKLNKEHTQ